MAFGEDILVDILPCWAAEMKEDYRLRIPRGIS